MKLIRIYLEHKLKNKDVIYLIKSGAFYLVINEDAILLKNKGYDLKIQPLGEYDIKCGFPVSSKEKYENLLKADGINYEFIDKFEQKNFYKIDEE